MKQSSPAQASSSRQYGETCRNGSSSHLFSKSIISSIDKSKFQKTALSLAFSKMAHAQPCQHSRKWHIAAHCSLQTTVEPDLAPKRGQDHSSVLAFSKTIMRTRMGLSWSILYVMSVFVMVTGEYTGRW